VGLAQVLNAANRKEDWEGRVKALTALQQLVLKHGQAGAQPGPAAPDVPPLATKAASARFAAELAKVCIQAPILLQKGQAPLNFCFH